MAFTTGHKCLLANNLLGAVIIAYLHDEKRLRNFTFIYSDFSD